MGFFDRFRNKTPQEPTSFPPLMPQASNRQQVDPSTIDQFKELVMPADWALWLMAEHGQFDGSAVDSDILADVGRILTGCQLTLWETTEANGEKSYELEVGTTCPNFEAWFETIKSQNK